MAEIKLTSRGIHYFHMLMKVYSGSRTSAQLSCRQAVHAANYQMLIVANDKEITKIYVLLIMSACISAGYFYWLTASLDIILGLAVVVVSSSISAYLQVILAERYKLPLITRYGIWFFFGASFIVVLFVALSQSFLLTDPAWVFAALLFFTVIMASTHFHFKETLHFKNFLHATLQNALQYKLPAHVRGRVIRLSARDKYVSVRTVNGECEIRSTLAESITLNSQPGYRIHRSHWVAGDSIIELFRKNKKWFVTIEGPETLTVSHKIAPQIEADKNLKIVKKVALKEDPIRCSAAVNPSEKV